MQRWRRQHGPDNKRGCNRRSGNGEPTDKRRYPAVAFAAAIGIGVIKQTKPGADPRGIHANQQRNHQRQGSHTGAKRNNGQIQPSFFSPATPCVGDCDAFFLAANMFPTQVREVV